MNGSKTHTYVKNAIAKALKDTYKDQIKVTSYPGGPMGDNGFPDLVICLNGLYIELEVKTGEAGLGEQQRFHRKATKRAGGVHMVGRTPEGVLARFSEIA